jgi:general secretion pathway protein G
MPRDLLKPAFLASQPRGVPGTTTSRKSVRGFTLLEMVVVVSIITIMMAIAIPIYNRSILHARERALQSDLDMLNKTIVQYTLDKQKAPQSLDDLKTAGYIQKIPNDPMTDEPNWEVEQDETLLSVDQQDPGVYGVHSASNAIGTNGQAYSSWGTTTSQDGR